MADEVAPSDKDSGTLGSEKPPSPQFEQYFDPDFKAFYDEPAPAETRLADRLPATDTGNARRLVDKFGDRMAYVEEFGWMAYDGTRFTRDCLGILEAYAKETIRAIYTQAAMSGRGDEDRKKLVQWAVKSDNQSRIRAMVESARSEANVSARPETFDAHPALINTPNCVVDLSTGEAREHDPGYFFTRVTNARFEPEATCPGWEKFLLDIMGGDETLVDFLGRAVGYSLTASRREQVWFLLHGKGANGKSTFLNILLRVLGGYFQNTDPKVFLQNNRDGPTPEVARLRGARFIAATEPEENRRLAESFIKQWTGGDMITARHLHREPIEFEPVGKIWLSANHLPIIRADSHANWRRVRPIPFLVKFSLDAQEIAGSDGLHFKPADPDLEDRLVREESLGILAWCVRNAVRWHREGLSPPNKVLDALAEYRKEMDPLADFVESCCVLAPLKTVSVKDAYESYRAWCVASGADPIKKNWFSMNLRGKGVTPTNNGARGYRGIGLSLNGEKYLTESMSLREARDNEWHGSTRRLRAFRDDP